MLKEIINFLTQEGLNVILSNNDLEQRKLLDLLRKFKYDIVFIHLTDYNQNLDRNKLYVLFRLY